MDYVPPMAAVAAAMEKPHQADAASLAALKAVPPIEPTALDPRSTYALTPGTADAVLSLADMKTQAASIAEFDARHGHPAHITETVAVIATVPVVSPEPTKVASAAHRNWTEDVRLDHVPTRKVGTDTVVQYDTPRVIAAWSAAFPDIPNRKYRGLTPADTTVKPETGTALTSADAALVPKNIFLLCNTDNFKTFRETHPQTHINWIPVDNEDVLLFWPNELDRKEGDDLVRDVRVPEERGTT